MEKDSKKRVKSSVFPNYYQRLLVQACLLAGEAGHDAYLEWSSKFSFKNEDAKTNFSKLIADLDEGSIRLLPYLYKKYSSKKNDLLIQSIKPFYQQNWCKNQALWTEFKALTIALNQQEIVPLLTKGMALTLLYYKDMGIRPMNDVDLAVPIGQVDLSLKIIQDNGWIDSRTGERVHEAEGLSQDARGFINTKNVQMDFHWRIIKEQLDQEWIMDNWDSATDLTIEGVKLKLLHPGDQLIHTFLHGLTWNKVPPFRWILDAHKIIQDEHFDWNYLFDQSNKRKCNAFVLEGLKYLIELEIIDYDIIALQKQLPVDRLQQHYYNTKCKKIVPGSFKYALFIFNQIRLFFPGSNIKGIRYWAKSFVKYRKNSNRNIFKLISFFLLKTLGLKQDTPYHRGLEKIKMKSDS